MEVHETPQYALHDEHVAKQVAPHLQAPLSEQ
jgi:hypothetical protein